VASLVLVQLHVRGAVVRRDLTEEVADVVTSERALQLHHGGPEVAKQHSQAVTGEELGRFDRPDPVQQPAYDALGSVFVPSPLERT
jgi:hypothetical protein